MKALIIIRAEIGAEAASFFMLHEEAMFCAARPVLAQPILPAWKCQPIKALSERSPRAMKCAMCATPPMTAILPVQSMPKPAFTKSMICVPVSGNGKRFGALQLINRLDGALFSDDDAALVSVYGKSAALALANSQMAKRMVEADNIQRDLQNGLARAGKPVSQCADFDFIHGVNVPKKGVSGDLYDYVSRDGQIYFCMADVSGKGTDAALVMAKTHSLFRSLSRNRPAVNELASRMNGELVETAFNGMFVTAIIGQYDPESGAMQCCNAGHEPGPASGCLAAFLISKPACNHWAYWILLRMILTLNTTIWRNLAILLLFRWHHRGPHQRHHARGDQAGRHFGRTNGVLNNRSSGPYG